MQYLKSLVLAMLAVVLAVTGMAALGAPASAHNVLISSDPEDGATLPVPPEQVTLVFNDGVLDVGTAFEVTGPDGKLQLDPPAVQGSNAVQVLPDGLPAGDYSVVWRVTSADGHPIDGTLTFTATSGAGAPTTDATTEATTEPTTPATEAAQPSPTPSEDTATPVSSETEADSAETGGVPAWVWVAGVIVLVGAVAAGMVAARRNRDRIPNQDR